MAAFQRKTNKFVSQLNWNRSIDTIPDGQAAFALNVRQNQQGELTSRPGLTSYATGLVGAPTEINSISRLNNYSASMPFFDFVYIVGADQKLFVGKTQADFQNASINPVRMPPGGGQATLSGNPLTMVDAAPASGVSGWKYIGDSTKMMTVGYRPGDTPGTNMARALTMGMLPPVWFPNTADGTMTVNGGGLLNGAYQWAAVFRRMDTGAVSNPSAASRNTLSAPAIVLTNQSVTLTAPATPIDPQTGSPDANIAVDIYRFGGVVNRWSFVASVASAATFTDNLPDSQILSNPSPPTFTDPVTGLTRFDRFMPFPVQDVARFNSGGNPGNVVQHANGVYTIAASGGDTFATGILQGSTISINNAIFTVYQVRSSTVIEIAEDPGGTLVSGSNYPWAIPAGTLVAGMPMPHIWGPFGTGNAGSVIFGCGNPQAEDTLYWTNGNDPDSTDIANSLVVTSPSEPLRGGCVFNGVAYVFSTERMFRIYPQGNNQFFTQEVGGGHGLWMEWSLNVQSNSISDQSISWRTKEGICNYTEGGGVQLVSDQFLYPFFPHENAPGDGVGTVIGATNAAGKVFPALNSRVLVQVPPPDDRTPKYHKINWFQGVLYYDYLGRANNTNQWYTLVLDFRQAQGWVSMDHFFAVTTNVTPVTRCSEIAADNLKVCVGASIYDFFGPDDAGTAIQCQWIGRQDDCGDERGQKLYGDFMFDLDAGGRTVNIQPLTDYAATALPTVQFSQVGRIQSPVDLSTNGLGVLSRTFGLNIFWTAQGANTVTLFQYVFSYVPKPEITGKRALDKTDDGFVGSKYLRGFVIETNTFGTPRAVNVLVDGVKALAPGAGTVFAINANSQAEIAFGVTPIVGSEFQLAIDSSDTSTVGWEVFQVRWIYEQWPDLARESSPIMDLGNDRAKFVQGCILPIDTANGNVTLQILGDAGVVGFTSTAIATTGKTAVALSWPPFIAHLLQIVPNAACRIWWNEIVWIFEPEPELATIWQTPPTTHGLTGYIHQRQFWIAYLSTSSVTFTRIIANGTAEAYTLPSTGGLYRKALLSALPSKFLATAYSAVSDQPFRLYLQDSELSTKQWGGEAFQGVRVLGSASMLKGADI